MNIDLTKLHNNIQDNINITGEYEIDSSYYKDSDIVSLSLIKVNGKIIEKEADDGVGDYITCKINGSMVLLDSISMEEVDYPFSIDYDDFIEENCFLNENILDIFEFLWENILLEVPLHYTKVEDIHEFCGDGWKLIREDEVKNNNPFYDLLKDIEKE